MLCQIGLFSEGVVQRMAPSRRPSGHDGNSKTVFSIIGASNHSETERHAEDYYATPPSAVEQLLDLETFSPRILEPSCGGGHISRVLEGGSLRMSPDGYSETITEQLHTGCFVLPKEHRLTERSMSFSLNLKFGKKDFRFVK